MFRKKKNRAKRSLSSCVQVAMGWGRKARDEARMGRWYLDEERENEREGEVGRGGEEREWERKPPPPPPAVDRALGPRLMKLSVEDVYRWGLPACGPFTATAAGLVKSCFTSQPGVCESGGGGRKGDGRYIGISECLRVHLFTIRITSELAFFRTNNVYKVEFSVTLE